MTNTGMFEDAERIEYLEEQNKLLKKKLRESINSKVIDTLETDIGIKDWHIQKLKDKIKDLKDEIKDLKDALEKTE
jgi:predicted  nucleic acid-binding Zn-ribbon protein